MKQLNRTELLHNLEYGITQKSFNDWYKDKYGKANKQLIHRVELKNFTTMELDDMFWFMVNYKKELSND